MEVVEEDFITSRDSGLLKANWPALVPELGVVAEEECTSSGHSGLLKGDWPVPGLLTEHGDGEGATKCNPCCSGKVF